MNIYVANVIQAKSIEKENFLKLEAEFPNGVPPLEFEFLIGFQSFKIISISSKNTFYEVILDFGGFYWNNINTYLERYNKSFLCINKDEFQNFNKEEKIKYFEKIVQLYGKGTISKFLNKNLKTGKYINFSSSYSEGAKSKFGGLPLANPAFEFPKDKNGRSSLFIGQIQLEILGQSGILYIFGSIRIYAEEYYSFDDFQLIFSKDSENLTKIPLPKDLEEYGVFKEVEVTLGDSINIPPHETSLWSDFRELENHEYWKYFLIGDIFGKLIEQESQLKLFGHPDQIQGCILFDTECKSREIGWYDPEQKKFDLDKLTKEIEPKATEWMLLFQLDTNNMYFHELSNFKNEFCKYMDGNYYLMIRKNDFRNLDFHKTLLNYQST